MSQHGKGSSKLLLEWTKKPREQFVNELNELINLNDVEIGLKDWWRPDGSGNPKECLTKSLPSSILSSQNRIEINNWWLRHSQGANTPNWDFISSANIAGRSGLVIMEAKSHYREFNRGGKRLKKDASKHSIENHERINMAIAEANASLQANHFGINISIKSHYQLANRIAYAWKFATLGIPVVLIFLGFIKDTEMKGYFQDKSDWIACMKNYLDGVFPSELLEKDIKCPPSFFRFLIRSL